MATTDQEFSIEQLCISAVKASIEAGRAILRHYPGNYSIEYKEDKSPLTSADNQSHQVISEHLAQTGIPILSEEGRNIPYAERSQWNRFWLVDPLDGTKEFINQNGEFTVNIALIEGFTPVIGVIYIPVTGVLYFATSETGSFRSTIDHKITNPETATFSELIKLSVKLPLLKDRPVTIIGSRSHQNPENTALIQKISAFYKNVQVVNVGSSLKFCRLAEGSADYYPRIGPTMEWDTAAGDAIARYSGAKVINYYSHQALLYNKENLLNPPFIVITEEHYKKFINSSA